MNRRPHAAVELVFLTVWLSGVLPGVAQTSGAPAVADPPAAGGKAAEWTDAATTAALLKAMATLDAGLAKTFYVDEARNNRGGLADREGIEQLPTVGLNGAERSVIELDAHLKTMPPGPQESRVMTIRMMLADFVASARRNVFDINTANYNAMKADQEMDSARLWMRPGRMATGASSAVNAKNKHAKAQQLAAEAESQRKQALEEIQTAILTLDRRLDSLPMPQDRDVALALARAMHRVKDAMLPFAALDLTWDAVWVRRELMSASEREGALGMGNEAMAYLVKPVAAGTREAVGSVVADLRKRAESTPATEKASLILLAGTLTELFAAEASWHETTQLAALNRQKAAEKETHAPARLVPNTFGTVNENGYLKMLRDAKHLRQVADTLERQASVRMAGALYGTDAFLSALPETGNPTLALSLAQMMHRVRARTIPKEKLDLIWTARRLELALMPPQQRNEERMKAFGWLVLHLGSHGVLQAWDPGNQGGFTFKTLAIRANSMAMGQALETLWPGVGNKGRLILQKMILSMAEKKERWQDLIAHPAAAGIQAYALEEYPALNRVCNASQCIDGLVELFKLCDPNARK